MIFGRASSIRDSTGTNETVTTVNGDVALTTRQRNGYILTTTLTALHRPAGVNILPGVGAWPGASGQYIRLYSHASRPAFPPHANVAPAHRPGHNLTTAGEIPRTGRRMTLEDRHRQTLPEYPAYQASRR